MLGSLLTILAAGIVAIIAASAVFWVIGTAVSLATVLLFKVAPVLLVGWVVIKVLENRKQKKSYLSDADRRWLEGD